MELNLGCGISLIQGAVNIDITRYTGIDKIMNLDKFPWEFENNSIDGIYLIHSLEHFQDYQRIILECHRILKFGGFLHIQAPHSTNVSGIGCFGHSHTFNYNTFDDYLTRPIYQYGKGLFKTKISYMNYFGFKHNPWFKDTRHKTFLMRMLIPMDYIMSWIINLCPPLYEKLLHSFLGDASEVVWRGIKT